MGAGRRRIVNASTNGFPPFPLHTVNEWLRQRDDRPNDEQIPLLPKAFAMLRYRMDRAGQLLTLELNNLTLVCQDAVGFPARCAANCIQLNNCPAYIREWINGERQ
jgi:hypothetical protein